MPQFSQRALSKPTGFTLTVNGTVPAMTRHIDPDRLTMTCTLAEPLVNGDVIRTSWRALWLRQCRPFSGPKPRRH